MTSVFERKTETRKCRHHSFYMWHPQQGCEECRAAGDSMSDVRDISLQCDSDVPWHFADVLIGFGLRNYRGPITAIRVTGHDMALQVDFRVPDSTTGVPVTLTVFSGYLHDEMYIAGPKAEQMAEHVGRLIRRALHYTVTHELDECLLYRGDFVHHPHPEQQHGKR